MRTIDRLLPLAGLSLALSACASGGDYPSLAQRPAERVEGAFTPDSAATIPPPPVAPSADLVERLSQLLASAQAAHDEFRRATPAAQRLVNAAGASGSDSWAAAQVALADLDSLRSQGAVALADLDTLWADSTIEDGPREAVGAARSAVETLIAEEDTVLAGMRGRL